MLNSPNSVSYGGMRPSSASPVAMPQYMQGGQQGPPQGPTQFQQNGVSLANHFLQATDPPQWQPPQSVVGMDQMLANAASPWVQPMQYGAQYFQGGQ